MREEGTRGRKPQGGKGNRSDSLVLGLQVPQQPHLPLPAAPKTIAQVDLELEGCLGDLPGPNRVKAQSLLQQFDEEQRRAAHGVLVDPLPVTLITGPAGSGKSTVLQLLTIMLGDALGVSAPTNGARRAAQEQVDRVRPPRSFMPELEVLTNHTAFGVGHGKAWDAVEVIPHLLKHEKRKAKATYNKRVWIIDEGAQTPFEHLDMAEEVARIEREDDRSCGGINVVLLMDAKQTPPIRTTPDAHDREMIWDGELITRAKLRGELRVCDPVGGGVGSVGGTEGND